MRRSLREWELPRLTVTVAYPTRRHLPAKVGRLVDFLVDNECGKGDRRHLRGADKPCRFKDLPALLQDFMRDVEASK